MSHFFAPERYDTPEFTIRACQPGDGKLLHDALTTSADHLRPFLYWLTFDATLEEHEQLVRTYYSKYLAKTDFIHGVFAPDGTRLLGWTGFLLRGRTVEHGTGEIGMWISATEAGKGLGTRVLKQMLHWGFTAWPWQRIEWKCDTLNLASAAVARKAGMRLEGTFRQDHPMPDGTRCDTHYFAMLREEYRPDEE
ncbi:MAG: GNAT family N-acetyltransferase [Anaerolineae bacterium]|nr:GNAT family N-acetyltransferase [Anaerolineae bacterium]